MDAFAIEEPSGGGRGCDEGVRTDKIMCRVKNYISYATTHAPSKQWATKDLGEKQPFFSKKAL